MDTPTRRCYTCKQYFPATPEHFTKNPKGKYGLGSQCRICNREYHRRRMQNPEIRERHHEQVRQNCRSGRYNERNKQYRNRPEIKERKKEYNGNYYREKHDAILQQKREYGSRPEVKERRRKYAHAPENREREQARARQRRKEQPEIFRVRDRKRYQERYRNPQTRGIFRAMAHRRLARKNAVPQSFTADNWQHAVDYFNGCCAVCGRQQGLWHIIAADHWIPLKSPNCPGTVPKNIIPLCHGQEGCNNRKHDKQPEIWLVEQFGKRKAKAILARIEAYFRSLS